ncbi:MAG: matrixin family metalloprotease [Candidatus Scalindua sp.]|nr:matrixin family metalloprotease [Candidatus Scalindua sp.]
MRIVFRKKYLLAFASIILFYSFTGTSSFAYKISVNQNGQGTKWEAGANTASSFNPYYPPGTPGGATWSIMPAGLPAPYGDNHHGVPANDTDKSKDLIGSTGLPDVNGKPYEIWAIKTALDLWASVSNFTNLGKVDDGAARGINTSQNGWNGNAATNNNGGHRGDIRIGCYITRSGVLADTWQPGTENDSGQYGNIGGDMHLASRKGYQLNKLTWVDDGNDTYTGRGDITYDYFTTVLHEMGHALGLDHSEDPNSVMATYNVRGHAQRTLTQDDIEGIQAIYGNRFMPVEAVYPPVTVVIGTVCSFDIMPVSKVFDSSGGTGSISVSSNVEVCGWSAESNVSWITITSGSNDAENGTVEYSVSPIHYKFKNKYRTGTITIAGMTFTVTQHNISPTLISVFNWKW